MKNVHNIKKIISCICVVILCAVCVPCMGSRSKAVEKSDKTIKVGYIDYKGFIEENSEEAYTGYGVDYLNEIAKYTGWKYEFVYDTWENHLQALKDGKIDIVCQAQITPERQKDYLFSKYSDGAESSVLYVKNEDTRYYYNDFEHFNGMRIAMMDGSFQNEEFREFAKKNGFSYKEMLYENISDGYEALEKGEVDAVAAGSLAVNTTYRSVCQFGSDPFYFMTAKQNQDIIDDIDSALGQIKALNQSLESDLYDKYYGSSAAKAPIAYTREEAEWLAKKEKVTVALIPANLPFSYQNDNGDMAGITKDIVDLIAQKSGLNIQYTLLEAGQSTMDYLEKNPNNFVAGVEVDNPNFTKENNVITDAYYTDDVVLVCNPDTRYDIDAPKDSYRLALPASYTALISYVKQMYPQFTIKTYKTNEICLEHVKDGDADFLAQNINTIKPLLQKPLFSEMTILPSYFMQEKQGIVGKKSDKSSIINSIFNKAIANLTDEETEQSVVNRTMENRYSLTTKDFIYKFRYTLIIISALLVLLALGVWIFIKSRRHNYVKLEAINKSLEDAVAVADHANMAKSQFLAQMSHEIRTPMNAIIGLTDIAKMETDPSEKVNGYLDKIAGSSKLLLGIINDVLDMSAIEGGKLKIDSAEYNFKRQISDITTMFYQQAQQKDIHFEVKMKGVTEETIVGDQLRVNQILMNLLSNAIKFTSAGGTVKMLVIQASRAREHVQYRFVISDTGCGMSEEMLSRIFKPFEQESASTARKHGGSGLGLSIAKRLSELMGGTISVESEQNVGTTFTVDIPFEISKNQVNYDNKLEFADVRTLVVDDDKESCDYSGILLKRLGVRFDYALSGEDALMMLGEAEDQDDPYKLCLIDWQMPEMDGMELTREIREIFGQDAVVIMVSAYDLNEVEREGSQAGVDYYITKPLFQSTLFNALMQISSGDYTRVEDKNEAQEFDFSGKHVLIAEDVALNMEVAIKLLGMVGIICTCAEDGKQAVEIYEKSEEGFYDCIFLDINMPVMDGYEAARRIRESSRGDAKTIPIYAMTANAFAEDVTNAMNAGMNGHIAKPIETKILYSVLEQIWKKGE